ncbi:uncharacterized protein SPSK_05725 [Sporothrix schenckii 1099-18]|uniref:Uncharacterized protein n=1 Tax=Sporothrix schenckii 1099-18 TaxID=1397361 RepID=A0A0F2LRU5_SPOSC|nr:uncharacterized protein SPSK_05725 [Sporothrix schenckii 1099-18]KJR80232.1 hypothetical protein SPSK_05725 [Sporothrix schenckii 1099-18]
MCKVYIATYLFDCEHVAKIFSDIEKCEDAVRLEKECLETPYEEKMIVVEGKCPECVGDPEHEMEFDDEPEDAAKADKVDPKPRYKSDFFKVVMNEESDT